MTGQEPLVSGAIPGTAPLSATGPLLSLVIAVQGAQANLAETLAVLPPDPGGTVEVLICHASDDPVAAGLPARPDLRWIEGRAGALIPELWRDGILTARGEWVATLTLHCPPCGNWLACALKLIRTEASHRLAGFGGTILCDPKADRTTRAIQLLRYADAGADPGMSRRVVADISADNALYRRAAVLACADLLPDGFWEPNYHRRFEEAGLILEQVPDLVVAHRNRYGVRDFARQRRRHGRVFGRHRGEAATPGWRALMVAASPAAVVIFAAKQTRKILSRRDLRAGFPSAAPLFYLFMLNWCIGEAVGYVDAIRSRSGSRSGGQSGGQSGANR